MATTPSQGDNNMTTTFTLKVPTRFFDDHVSRGCVIYSGEKDAYVVQKTKTFYVVRLNEADAIDLISDADYYSTEWTQMDKSFFGLGRSAVATKKVVYQQMKMQGYEFSIKQIKDWSLNRLEVAK
jgi:hypothetical protein